MLQTDTQSVGIPVGREPAAQVDVGDEGTVGGAGDGVGVWEGAGVGVGVEDGVTVGEPTDGDETTATGVGLPQAKAASADTTSTAGATPRLVITSSMVACNAWLRTPRARPSRGLESPRNWSAGTRGSARRGTNSRDSRSSPGGIRTRDLSLERAAS